MGRFLGGFLFVPLQKVLNWIQITGIRGTDATRKPPLTSPGKANGGKMED
jgi:hypothetical protein